MLDVTSTFKKQANNMKNLITKKNRKSEIDSALELEVKNLNQTRSQNFSKVKKTNF
jgi:hypothetical protein